MPPPLFRTVSIGPYSFRLTQGYAQEREDFPITSAEREALDMLRTERVRKKGFKLLEKLRASTGRKTLTEAELRHLTDQIAQFDRDVRLERSEQVPRRASQGDRVTPPEVGDEVGEFEAELASLAEARVDAEERTRGLHLTPQLREAALRALREDPALREAARARVEVLQQARDKMVAELF